MFYVKTKTRLFKRYYLLSYRVVRVKIHELNLASIKKLIS